MPVTLSTLSSRRGVRAHASSASCSAWYSCCSASISSSSCAVHDLLQLVERQIDAVIGDAALRKVVGADALGAIAAAHLQAPRLRLRAVLLLLLGGQQARLQQRHGARAVLVLGALVLAFHHDAARQVRDAHGRVGLVDVLAAGAGGAVGVDAQIRRIDLDLLHLVELRQDGDRHRGGVDAALRFGRRHALHAMRAGLELQPRERALCPRCG